MVLNIENRQGISFSGLYDNQLHDLFNSISRGDHLALKESFSYDNNGNLIQKTSKQALGTFIKYTFNSENQLILIEEYEDDIKKKSFSYFYDVLGRRFQKEITNHEDYRRNQKR